MNKMLKEMNKDRIDYGQIS